MIAVIYSTFSHIDEAREMGEKLISQRLAVCSNISRIHSQFPWKGAFEESEEASAWFKTTEAKLPKALEFIRENHPYDIPLVTWEIREVNQAYADWMNDELES